MNFFKPTWLKFLIAFVLTIWPYVASYILVYKVNNGSIFSDNMAQLSFWEHTWHWSPLYLIIQLFPNGVYNTFWQSTFFLMFLYPLVRFLFRYIVACIIVHFAKKLITNHNRLHVEHSK